MEMQNKSTLSAVYKTIAANIWSYSILFAVRLKHFAVNLLTIINSD